MAKQASTENLKNTLAQQETPQAPAATQKAISPYRKVEAYLDKMAPQISKALPRTGVTAERLSRITLTTIKMNPALLDADIESLLGAVMQSASLGLEPNLLGSCYFIPYKDKNSGRTTVSFQIGYRGLIDLVTRSGEVMTIKANAVYSNDEFFYEYGLNENLKHVPARTDRGEVEYFYAYAKLKNGGHAFEVMSVEDINKIRDKHSVSYKFQKGNSIWGQHYDAMAKKTVIKQLVKYLPISVEIANDIAHDEVVRKTIDDEPQYVDPNIIDAEEFSEVSEQQPIEPQQEQAAE